MYTFTSIRNLAIIFTVAIGAGIVVGKVLEKTCIALKKS